MNDVYLGLGANLGDRLATLSDALHRVESLPATHVVRVSYAYETEPWGVADQPRYANAVALVTTSIAADALLEALHEIEDAAGRERTERYGARTLDIDILLYGDEEWQREDLVIPHPRMLEREFVVRPLLEIAPDVELPRGDRVTEERAVHGRIVGDLGALPGWEERTERRVPEHASAADAVIADGQEWVEVASSGAAGRIDRAPDFEMLFLQTVLDEEGIPFTFDPFAPTENYNPWGLTRPIRLLVPASYADRARRLIMQVRANPPVEPGEQ